MWKIFYGDDTEFSSEDGLPEQAPALNVQIIVQADERTGRYNQSGVDYYVFRDGRWIGVDIFGLFDFLMESGLVKFGRTIGSKKFNKIYQTAKADTFLPPRSAYKPGERR